ncbi:AAA family ATPase [Rahnella victoriana]|uniref:AAA family ATPase n=1 Tax=Rahnella victoriana TaxID=1510570 RepID=UPI001E52B5F5|nr:AAA family ATPase [Rahnella victoriana]
MYLAELTIKNFRKLREATLKFQPGLNVLVGPNNNVIHFPYSNFLFSLIAGMQLSCLFRSVQ